MKRGAGSAAVGGAALALLAATVQAGETPDVSLHGRLSYGVSYRMQGADPALVNSANGSAIGLTGGTSGGQNADDGGNNFGRHDATANVLKAVAEMTLRQDAWQAMVRARAWVDFALRDGDRPWGNAPNNYAANAPLSDAGFPRMSRFSGAAISDYYVQYEQAGAAGTLTSRLGQQSIHWGDRVMLGGGLAAIFPLDLAGARRPGAVPQEGRVALPALFERLAITPELALEGFYQWRQRANVYDGCGTFGSIADFVVDGCDKVFAGQPAGSDRARLAAGAYVKRIAPPSQPGGGQFGVALQGRLAALATDFGLYYARTAARAPNPGLTKSLRNGAPLIAGDPGGLNVRYFIEYPDDIETVALTMLHQHGKDSLYGEWSYRPNQPVQLSASDLLGAFISTVAPTPLRAAERATPAGGVFHGYDRLPVWQAQLGLQHGMSGAGLDWNGAAEVVLKQVDSLPDPTVRRYGRADAYGLGPVNGQCMVNTASAQRQCSEDGYVSARAYGYRLRLDTRIGLGDGLLLMPSAVFSHDLKGWSYDGLINQQRKSLNLALRFEYRERYVAELVYAPSWGGAYNVLADRDLLSLAAGVRF